jgi:exopolyphosphatase/guanosine-5'-triphosphate,3'-diphosphate pyrophosphatase
MLSWAFRLHEIGTSIAQAGFHKHSAYIVANADMPGFSRREQAALSALLMAQRGKLAKIAPDQIAEKTFVTSTLCLRLGVLLSRSRRNVDAKLFALSRSDNAFFLAVEPNWLAKHDLTDYELKQEAAEWAGVGISVLLSGGKPS